MTLQHGNYKTEIQALIQLSVALHHEKNGNHKAFEILCKKALSKLKQVNESNLPFTEPVSELKPEEIKELLLKKLNEMN